MATADAANVNEHDLVDAHSEFHFPRLVVGGLPVAVLDREQTARLTIDAAMSRRHSRLPCLFFTTVNGQVVSLAASRPTVRRMFEAADLISADGMSVVFASRLGRAAGLPERVATTDAFHDAAKLACDTGASFYLFGGDEEANRLAVERVGALYPRLTIAGRRSGYFDPRDEADIVDEINEAAPDVLWIGLGVPLQQEFVQRYLRRLTNVGVAKSCGGLFDFLSGRNRRAPRWMQKSGLEWAYRAVQDPMRLGWRYLTTNPHAAYWLVRARGPASDGAIALDAVV